MRGFESYSPQAWVEDIFAVHVDNVSYEQAPKTKFRSGKWSTAASGRAAVSLAAAAGVVVSALFAAGPSSVTSAPIGLMGVSGVNLVARSSAPPGSLAPVGYVDALMEAVRSVVKLQPQSIEADPPFQF